MGVAVIILSVIFVGVACVFLANTAKLLDTDIGRVMVCALIALMVASCPIFDSMPVIDRLAAMAIGGMGLNLTLRYTFGRAQYDVLQLAPVILMEARRGSYRLQMQVAGVSD